MRRKNVAVIAAGIALAAYVAALGAPSDQRADTVLLNGKILTVNEKFPVRQALAIREFKDVPPMRSVMARVFEEFDAPHLR